MRISTETLIYWFVRALAFGGPALLLGSMAWDSSWATFWFAIVGIMIACLLLRAFKVSLGKYAYIAPSGVVGLSGAILVGPIPTAAGLALGTLIADWSVLRKHFFAASVNVGREIIALYSAYGLYAAALTLSSASSPITREGIPAVAIFASAYLLVWRGLFYYSLLVRQKLRGDEKLLILRYEIITGGLMLLAAAAVVFTVAYLPILSWVLVAAPLSMAGLMFKRILEEAIQAEELNKLHAMDAVITGTSELEDSFVRIERLVHRILDWGDFRIYALRNGQLVQLYQGAIGRPRRGPPPDAYDELRAEVMRTGRPVVISDSERDQRTAGFPDDIRSLVVQPLMLGNDLIGTLELEHHKRKEYGGNQLALLDACAHRVATAVHISDLRRPLVDTVARIGAEVRNLRTTTDFLRNSASEMEQSSTTIGQGLSQQDQEVANGLTATEQLSDTGRDVVESGAQAAKAGQEASEVAQQSRETIRGAIEKLVGLKNFVAEASDKVRELEAAARNIVRFISSIRELADMTNLLALNAGIEAARAGDHGRGFAVVAHEIRRLAEQSGSAADEAGQLVGDLQTRLGEVVDQIRRGQSSVSGVEQMSTEGLEALDSIVDATQAATAHARRIAATAEGQQQAFGGLRERINNVAVISSQNRTGADAVIGRAQDVTRQLNEMGQATLELEAVATMLADLTQRFTFAESQGSTRTAN